MKTICKSTIHGSVNIPNSSRGWYGSLMAPLAPKIRRCWNVRNSQDLMGKCIHLMHLNQHMLQKPENPAFWHPIFFDPFGPWFFYSSQLMGKLPSDSGTIWGASSFLFCPSRWTQGLQNFERFSNTGRKTAKNKFTKIPGCLGVPLTF